MTFKLGGQFPSVIKIYGGGNHFLKASFPKDRRDQALCVRGRHLG